MKFADGIVSGIRAERAYNYGQTTAPSALAHPEDALGWIWQKSQHSMQNADKTSTLQSLNSNDLGPARPIPHFKIN